MVEGEKGLCTEQQFKIKLPKRILQRSAAINFQTNDSKDDSKTYIRSGNFRPGEERLRENSEVVGGHFPFEGVVQFAEHHPIELNIEDMIHIFYISLSSTFLYLMFAIEMETGRFVSARSCSTRWSLEQENLFMMKSI